MMASDVALALVQGHVGPFHHLQAALDRFLPLIICSNRPRSGHRQLPLSGIAAGGQTDGKLIASTSYEKPWPQ